MAIHYLVYASSASDAFDVKDLDAILAASRRNNARAGLTGMLLFADGGFIQALEGSRDAVEQTYQRILDDPRHGGVQELFRGETNARQFPDWSMGYRMIEKSDLPRGVVDLRAETIRALENADTIVRTLFKNFYEAAHRFDPV